MRGACRARPKACPPGGTPVCAGDLKIHANACEAAKLGLNVLDRAVCNVRPPPVPVKPGTAGGLCGGFAGTRCEPGLVCDYGQLGHPAAPDEGGVCRPR
jgi:hypothetical protein